MCLRFVSVWLGVWCARTCISSVSACIRLCQWCACVCERKCVLCKCVCVCICVREEGPEIECELLNVFGVQINTMYLNPRWKMFGLSVARHAPTSTDFMETY